MEESVSMEEIFEMRKVNIKEYSPLTLAYIGDAVYDLIIRTLVVNKGNQQVQKLHKETITMVQASAQARMITALNDQLSEEEHAVYKRGRNAKSASPAKNQSISDYHKATGFEALLGYLYLKNDWKRMMELIKTGLEAL
ncbi:MAG: ribonuclease III [Dorea sp.]|jgi:ribonuclease-3 family protein|uniref:Mini-ribonuclease 3 n=1 Tax=Sporofaciens sp. JLR.KK001 TaxID=3112621 RepID=UPI00216FFE5C|nr:ribonuclease III [Dorea sp.]